MDAVRYIQDWTINFLKHRDLMLKRIKSLEEKEGELAVETKDGMERYVIDLGLDRLSELMDQATSSPDTRLVVICLNNTKNVDKLLSAWKSASTVKGLAIYFVNPFSEPDKKWIIRPHTHARISDPESLELGLRSLAEGVHTITTEQLTQRI